MKKYLLTLLACVSALLLTGCDIYKTEVYEVGADLFTDYVKPLGVDWAVYGEPGCLGCYAYQVFEFPEIDARVMDKGQVSVYYCNKEIEENVSVDRDHPLPYVFTVKNEYNYDITQNIRFSVEQGFLRLIVEWSDARIYNQPDQTFKVCILRPVDEDKKR